jgi:FixJ family two-component response regulator
MQHVLVIDDENATLTMFRLFLKAFGYDVHVAEDGDSGLRAFKDHYPPIVFTDLKMPGIDGFDVLRTIKKSAPQTEVIVITGHGDMDLALRALNLEATDFINKPVRRSALQAALERAEHRTRNPGERRCRIAAAPDQTRALVITIRGILDGTGKTSIRSILERQPPGDGAGVVFHFAPHASFNGEGLDTLIRLMSEMKQNGVPIAISGLCENFRTVMEMIGLPKSLPSYDTLEDALAHF